MQSSHAVPPAEDQRSKRAARGVSHDSRATAGERSVMAFSLAPVEEKKRGKNGRDRRKILEQNASGALENMIT